jgi:hypothetical protein
MKLVYIFFLCMCFQVQAQDWVQVTSLPNVFNETHHSFAFSFDDMGYIVSGNSDSGVRDDFYQYNPATDSWPCPFYAIYVARAAAPSTLAAASRSAHARGGEPTSAVPPLRSRRRAT